MFIIQNETSPGTMQAALSDLMRKGVNSMRVCCAYMTMSGAETLWDTLVRAPLRGHVNDVHKTIVSSLDFGITDPAALQFWVDQGSRVLVAGSGMLDEDRLIPRVAFHPKFYLFGRPDGSMGSLVGLTNRGLTINTEAGWLEMELGAPQDAEAAWADATHATAVLVRVPVLAHYAELHARVALRPEGREELEPVPEPPLGDLRDYLPFAEANLDFNDYSHMWVQSRSMQGGARTQLELPRGSHHFFGAVYRQYNYERVVHIAEPVLVSGQHRWVNRPLTWHGDNAMERINLPSARNGGFQYPYSLILFRRIDEPNTFELRVHPWASDAARAYVEASRRAGLIFRVGQNTDRLAGFLN